MDTTSRASTHRIGVAAIVMSLVLGVATVVAAQSGPSTDCSGDSVVQFGTEFFGLEDEGNRLLSTSPSQREYPLPTPMPAGTYSLNGVSYDGYPERETISPQTREQWYVEFLASDGSVLAASGITADLADAVQEADWSGSLGEITLATPASVIRVVHAAPGSVSVNSVRPVCIGATNTAVPASTTTTTEAAQVAPPSFVGVDFVSTAPNASTLSMTCGARTESATGTELTLEIRNIPAGSGCAVEYPINLDCVLSVDPKSTQGASAVGVQNLIIPVAGGATVNMTIDCVERLVGTDNPPTTTTLPVATTTTTAPTTKVAEKVETAPAATAQDGQPAFTG